MVFETHTDFRGAIRGVWLAGSENKNFGELIFTGVGEPDPDSFNFSICEKVKLQHTICLRILER